MSPSFLGISLHVDCPGQVQIFENWYTRLHKLMWNYISLVNEHFQSHLVTLDRGEQLCSKTGRERTNGEELHQEDCRASGSWVRGQSPGSGSVLIGKFSICFASVSMVLSDPQYLKLLSKMEPWIYFFPFTFTKIFGWVRRIFRYEFSSKR